MFKHTLNEMRKAKRLSSPRIIKPPSIPDLDDYTCNMERLKKTLSNLQEQENINDRLPFERHIESPKRNISITEIKEKQQGILKKSKSMDAMNI